MRRALIGVFKFVRLLLKIRRIVPQEAVERNSLKAPSTARAGMIKLVGIAGQMEPAR